MSCYASLPGRQRLDDYTPVRQLFQTRSAAGVVSDYDWTGWTGTAQVSLAADESALFTATLTTPTTDGYLSFTPSTAQAALFAENTEYLVQFLMVPPSGGTLRPMPPLRLLIGNNL